MLTTKNFKTAATQITVGDKFEFGECLIEDKTTVTALLADLDQQGWEVISVNFFNDHVIIYVRRLAKKMLLS